jgi:FkbM family methyltransferase
MNRCEKLYRILVEAGWRQALICHGVAASAEHVQALMGLRLLYVVDVGANRGQFSLLARGLYPDAIIVAFEPLRQAAKTYRQVFLNDTKVTLRECALGESSGKCEIHISGADDSSSLLPITELQASTFPGTGEVGTAEVSVATLSGMLTAHEIGRPALIKLDVQGFELNTLKGAESLLPLFDYIYCECSFIEMYEGQPLADEIVSWLQVRGFPMRGIYNVSYDRSGKAVQADFLFSRT